MPDDAFEVKFLCENCGAEWADEYPSRTLVDDDDRVVQVRHLDCEQSFSDCDCCETVTCPVCEVTPGVAVTDRSPLDDEPEPTPIEDDLLDTQLGESSRRFPAVDPVLMDHVEREMGVDAEDVGTIYGDLDVTPMPRVVPRKSAAEIAAEIDAILANPYAALEVEPPGVAWVDVDDVHCGRLEEFSIGWEPGEPLHDHRE